MNTPHSSGPRSHDHEESRAEREVQRQTDALPPEPPAGCEIPHGSAPDCDQRSVPSTPGELVAMQRHLGEPQPHPEQAGQERVEQTLALLQNQDLNPWETQQIALALLQQLESYHQSVVAELHDTSQSTPAQVACWAIDGDRLMHCRRLLESITLI